MEKITKTEIEKQTYINYVEVKVNDEIIDSNLILDKSFKSIMKKLHKSDKVQINIFDFIFIIISANRLESSTRYRTNKLNMQISLEDSIDSVISKSMKELTADEKDYVILYQRECLNFLILNNVPLKDILRYTAAINKEEAIRDGRIIEITFRTLKELFEP